MPILMTFNVKHLVPKGGTIQVKFGSNVPKVYGHCRSMIRKGSQLTAVGGSSNG